MPWTRKHDLDLFRGAVLRTLVESNTEENLLSLDSEGRFDNADPQSKSFSTTRAPEFSDGLIVNLSLFSV